jgi:catechol 2,3-dioxygenase-like lactoylglutathione lyase family enzyme
VSYQHLHHVQLAMPRDQEDDARSFYAGVLGMDEIDKPPVLAARGGAWFRGGEVELHLGVEDDFRPARKGHPGILTDDLDGVVLRLQNSGQLVQWDGNFPGFRRVYAHDSFGNRLEFLEPVSRWSAFDHPPPSYDHLSGRNVRSGGHKGGEADRSATGADQPVTRGIELGSVGG